MIELNYPYTTWLINHYMDSYTKYWCNRFTSKPKPIYRRRGVMFKRYSNDIKLLPIKKL